MNDHDDPQLPPDLIAALKRHDARPPGPSADTGRLDAAVRAAADEHFGSARRRLQRWRLVVGPLAAAAVVGLVLWLGNTDPTVPTTPAVANDFNGDGQVDVLDVLRLAQQLRVPPSGEGVSTPPRSAAIQSADVNGDGRLDQQDVDALAQAIVRLSPPATPAYPDGGPA